MRPPAPRLRPRRHRPHSALARASGGPVEPVLTTTLFIETGVGADQHGQDATKACVRVCRNAIEFNSIPCLESVIPGGKANLKLAVKIGTPFPATVDLERVAAVFPYGRMAAIEVAEGGLNCRSGIVLEELGDANDDFLIAVAAVTVGY